MIKARVVVRRPRLPGALRAHIGYLQRVGVTRDGSAGKLFDSAGDGVDGRAFVERSEGDRHHFRFIVSPDEAGELGNLRSFTRDLMDQASRDLGTRLDWIAIDHWNTEHPHVHIVVRGRADNGSDLVISRDYIGTGLRARRRSRHPRARSQIRTRDPAWPGSGGHRRALDQARPGACPRSGKGGRRDRSPAEPRRRI